MTIDQQHLLGPNSAFCVLPWLHLHSDPTGVARPCCQSKNDDSSIGRIDSAPVDQLINQPYMQQLRLDMLDGKQHANCSMCWQHERLGIPTARQDFNRQYGHHLSDLINSTKTDGTIVDFRMRHFDLRFSNICNFKCRTCNSAFSTQWEQEDLKHHRAITPKARSDSRLILEQVVQHIPHLEAAYFAGGEPLITDEHYELLEEMIRQGRTDIKLSYSTNISHLRFKGRDLLQLWQRFGGNVTVWASIDHVKHRAEYIRHGTDWAVVESNMHQVRSLPYINFGTSTVLSVFNYVTLAEMQQYLIDQSIIMQRSQNLIYGMQTPVELTAQVIPKHLKAQGTANISTLIDSMSAAGFADPLSQQLRNAIAYANDRDIWTAQRHAFTQTVKLIDSARSEDFAKTFPELAEMIEQ